MFLLKKKRYLSNWSKCTFLSCSWECYTQQISGNHGRQLRWERFLLCIAQRLQQRLVTAKASQTVDMENEWVIWTWSRLPGERIEIRLMCTEKTQYNCGDGLQVRSAVCNGAAKSAVPPAPAALRQWYGECRYSWKCTGYHSFRPQNEAHR